LNWRPRNDASSMTSTAGDFCGSPGSSSWVRQHACSRDRSAFISSMMNKDPIEPRVQRAFDVGSGVDHIGAPVGLVPQPHQRRMRAGRCVGVGTVRQPLRPLVADLHGCVEEQRERHRSRLMQAADRGEVFDVDRGLLDSMAHETSSVTWYEHACAFADARRPKVAAKGEASFGKSARWSR
jgi:hypothetical protein